MGNGLSGLQIAERWVLLRSKGGMSALAYWLLRTVLRVDVYKVMSLDLTMGFVEASAKDCRFVAIRSMSDLPGLDARLLSQLNEHCGWGVEGIVTGGGRVYAVVSDSGVLCQLNIDTLASRIDTPCDLTLDLSVGECFLGFLYTQAHARRGGWALYLLAQVRAALALEGFLRCHCHVQATNLRSLNTFRAGGWKLSGLLAATPTGRYIGSFLGSRPGLKIRRSGSR